MRLLALLSLLLCISACYQKNVYEFPAGLLPYRDTIIVRDTVVVIMKDSSNPANTSKILKKGDVKKETVKQVHDPHRDPVIHMRYEKEPSTRMHVKIANSIADTIFHYYKNSKKVSVKITPQTSDRQLTILYDPFGNETYRMESVHASYQVSVRLKFHDNGAVSEANIHTNPGASMYWYETYITFSINNEPEWKRSETHPQRSVEIPVKEYWDKRTGQWKKQELMEGLPAR